MNELTRILVVDDDPLYRLALRRGLERCEFEVIEACSGKEALTLVGRTTFELVILDVDLPDIRGPKLLKLIHNEKKVSVVLTTASAQEVNADNANQLGAIGFLPKPYTVSQLLSLLSSLDQPFLDWSHKQATTNTNTGS